MSAQPAGGNREADEPKGIPTAVPSGIEVPVVVTRDMCRDSDIGDPGQYPFTRGIFADGFRGRPWTMRQYSGFGTAEESNERYRFLLAQGQTGLSVALDLPTQVWPRPHAPDGAAGDRQGRRLAFESVRGGDPVPGPRPGARSRPRSRSTARPRSSTRCTWRSPTSRACRARS